MVEHAKGNDVPGGVRSPGRNRFDVMSLAGENPATEATGLANSFKKGFVGVAGFRSSGHYGKPTPWEA